MSITFILKAKGTISMAWFQNRVSQVEKERCTMAKNKMLRASPLYARVLTYYFML